MEANKSSKVFVNITRNKTRAAIARMSDMLLPNDDTNFGLSATPVPSMSASNGEPMQADMQQGAGLMAPDPGSVQPEQPGQQEQPEQDESPKSEREQAKEQADDAARQMQQQIEDDFAEANYNAHARDLIEDACQLGTGILKGPSVVNRTRRAWITDPQTGRSTMEVQQELRAGLSWVDFGTFSRICPRRP